MNSTGNSKANYKPGFARKTLAIAISASALATSTHLAAQGPALEEVVVTATRRAQSVQDIPYNISAVSGESLENAGISNVTDLVRMVPGLTAADVGGDSGVNNNLIIRGLNAQNPGRANILPNIQESAVSTYVNDTPVFFNLQLVDLQRVEVLRGPQGTLFGSGSVGGTVRFMLNDPDMEAATGSIEAGIGQSDNSDDLNYKAQGIGNLPLGDNFALRVSAYHETLGGVTDAIALSVLDENGTVVPEGGDVISGDHAQTSKDDTDERTVDAYKGALMWDVNDNVAMLATYLYQKNESDSDTYMRITDDDKSGEPWEHSRRFLTPGESELQLGSLEIDADLGFATFTSSTSYSETDVEASNDISALYEELDDAFGAYAGAPRLAALTKVEGDFEGFVQEFRLVSAGDGDWDWVAGAYYSDTDSTSKVRDVDHSFEDWMAAVDLGGGFTLQDAWNEFSDRRPPLDYAYYVQDREIQFEDMALFGELTWHMTDRLQATFGARAFWQEFDSKDFVALPFCGAFCSNDGEDLRGIATDTESIPWLTSPGRRASATVAPTACPWPVLPRSTPRLSLLNQMKPPTGR
jgi:outer membrane receptor protein involved in Fe transport